MIDLPSDIKYFSDDIKNIHPKTGKPIEWTILKKRLNRDPRPPRRLKTKTGGVDEILGGLAYGMHILYGKPGTGKSQFARIIATSLAEQGRKILYV